jgi:HSP20 family molecular chaperone IbpA
MGNERPSREDVVEATAMTAHDMPAQRVPVNAYETPGAFVVIAPMPAVTNEDVVVQFRDHVLHFYAELRSAGPRDFVIHEWEYGGFERELDVPVGFGAGLEAALNNGQLVIRVLRGDPIDKVIIHPSA